MRLDPLRKYYIDPPAMHLPATEMLIVEGYLFWSPRALNPKSFNESLILVTNV